MSEPTSIQQDRFKHADPQTVELFRKALTREHAQDWDMETVAEAAYICADALNRGAVNKTLKGDTPEKARARWREGGFGSVNDPHSKGRLHKYLKLFNRERTL